MMETRFYTLSFGEMAHFTVDELQEVDDKLRAMRKDIKALVEYKKRRLNTTFSTPEAQ